MIFQQRFQLTEKIKEINLRTIEIKANRKSQFFSK